MKKTINPIYSTFKGGYSSGYSEIDGKRSNCWEYTFCYDIFRFCKGNVFGKLTVPGVSYSLHMNTYHSYCYLPKWLKNKSFHWHFAFIKRWPFVLIGFKNVWKYMEVNI